MKSTIIYTIPGLGLDERIFDHLSIPKFLIHHLNWIEPISKNESISDYALRFSSKIDSRFETIILIGHSFGGVLCQEIAKHCSISKIILISSIKTSKELPIPFKLLKLTSLHRLISSRFAILSLPFWGYYHDYKTKAEKTLFKKIIGNQTDSILKWSLKTLSNWNNGLQISTPIISIHGDKDKTFPINKIWHLNYTLLDAGHFMVYKRSEEINTIIQNELNDLH
jgi:pimeloyl-ACP methyl ester carboxylesterase